jgi:hypothetical protein
MWGAREDLDNGGALTVRQSLRTEHDRIEATMSCEGTKRNEIHKLGNDRINQSFLNKRAAV